MSSELFGSADRAQLSIILKEACESVENLSTAILSTSDGHVVAVFSLKRDLDYHRLSAMAASFTGLSLTMSKETKIGSVARATVESENGLLLSHLINSNKAELTLTMIFEKGLNTGMAHWALNAFAKKISEII